MFIRKLLAIIVAGAVTLPAVYAQDAPAQAAQEAPAAPAGPSQLAIEVLAGAGATNSISQSTAVAPSVRVTDENNNPVAGAVVVFQTPETGPSATFATYGRLQTLHTNSSGIATASEYAPNGVGGSFTISVTATMGDATATATIDQSNVAPKPPSKNRKWIILGAVVAGVVALVALAYGHDTVN